MTLWMLVLRLLLVQTGYLFPHHFLSHKKLCLFTIRNLLNLPDSQFIVKYLPYHHHHHFLWKFLKYIYSTYTEDFCNDVKNKVFTSFAKSLQRNKLHNNQNEIIETSKIR